MGRTARRTWQKAEGRVAALFGARRQVGSGSSGRDDRTQSDSTHPRLFVETKLRQAHAARSLHDEVKARARREGKVPVVVLVDKGRPGALVCVHTDDLADFLAEYAAAHADPALRARVLSAVRGGAVVGPEASPPPPGPGASPDRPPDPE
jgi:hypothetical protein